MKFYEVHLNTLTWQAVTDRSKNGKIQNTLVSKILSYKTQSIYLCTQRKDVERYLILLPINIILASGTGKVGGEQDNDFNLML